VTDRRLSYLQQQVRWLNMRIEVGDRVSPGVLKAAKDLLFAAEKPYMDAGWHLAPSGDLVRIEAP
jgi:hypothetical protein